MAIITANYAAGQESGAAFKEAYEKAGGNVITTIPTPFPVTPDYQPYLQQAADRGAKFVWAFTPGGGEARPSSSSRRTVSSASTGRLVFGSNNMTDPQSVLDAEGDAALGIRTSSNWAPSLKNAENQRFLKAYDRFGSAYRRLSPSSLHRRAVPRHRR